MLAVIAGIVISNQKLGAAGAQSTQRQDGRVHITRNLA
jgi:hypothetical protein